VGKAESDGFTDAVGDIAGARLGPYTTKEAAAADYAERQAKRLQVPVPYEWREDELGHWLVNPKWGPSIGWFQVRSLRDPLSGNAADRFRVAEKLRDPLFNARAAFAISKGGTDFSFWTVYREGTYEKFLGQDYELKTGHARADDWDV
jgi:hypothetical protein